MPSFLPGLIVYIVFASIVSLMIIFKLQQAKKQNLVGRDLFMSIMPLFLAEGLFTVLFVIWLLPRL